MSRSMLLEYLKYNVIKATLSSNSHKRIMWNVSSLVRKYHLCQRWIMKKDKSKAFSDVNNNKRIQWRQVWDDNSSNVSSLVLKYQISQPLIKGLLVPFLKLRACPDLSWIIHIHPSKFRVDISKNLGALAGPKLSVSFLCIWKAITFSSLSDLDQFS